MKKRVTYSKAKEVAPEEARGKRRRPTLITAAALLACASAGLVAGAFNKPAGAGHGASPTPPPESARALQPGPQAALPGERLPGEVVAIRPWGFEPDEIIRPRGKFLLRVANRSGMDSVSLSIDAESGTRLRAETVHRTTLDWRGVVDLPPGNYLIREANNPDWVCKITVLP